MLKKFLVGAVIFFLGVLVGVAIVNAVWIKPINEKMARINESHLVAQANLLQSLEAKDVAAAITALNESIDRALVTIYVWSQLKVQPQDQTKEAITRVKTLRAESEAVYTPQPESQEGVLSAFKLLETQPQNAK